MTDVATGLGRTGNQTTTHKRLSGRRELGGEGRVSPGLRASAWTSILSETTVVCWSGDTEGLDETWGLDGGSGLSWVWRSSGLDLDYGGSADLWTRRMALEILIGRRFRK